MDIINVGKKELCYITKYDDFYQLKKELISRPNIFKFITDIDESTPCGKYDFKNEGYVNIIETQTFCKELEIFEAHKQFYDIQCLLSGEEKIYFDCVDSLKIKKEYDLKEDYYLLNVECNHISVTYKKGEAISIPNNVAHAPGYAADKCSTVKKAIIKIKI